MLRDRSDLDDFQDYCENHHSDSFDDNSFRWRIEFHLLIRGHFEKSSEKRVKHKVVKLILIYFIINNAFYKDEHITHSYEWYSNKQ